MTRKVRIIGIGSGHPDHMTVAAINALNSCDVLFVPTKGDEKAFLADLRREICDRYIRGLQPRMVHFSVPDRRRDGIYKNDVQAWHDAVADIYEDLMLNAVGENQTAGLLIWGDPMLYDGTLRTIERVLKRGQVAFDHDVIPGISSLQVLCAQHRIALNRIGGSVEITTGRRLSQGDTGDSSDIAIMLDAVQAFDTITEPDVDIYWGAYLGTPMEILISGPLKKVAPKIRKAREDARVKHGWIMDTYLLRRKASDPQ